VVGASILDRVRVPQMGPSPGGPKRCQAAAGPLLAVHSELGAKAEKGDAGHGIECATHALRGRPPARCSWSPEQSPALAGGAEPPRPPASSRKSPTSPSDPNGDRPLKVGLRSCSLWAMTVRSGTSSCASEGLKD
jgi:hypothetical protein